MSQELIHYLIRQKLDELKKDISYLEDSYELKNPTCENKKHHLFLLYPNQKLTTLQELISHLLLTIPDEKGIPIKLPHRIENPTINQTKQHLTWGYINYYEDKTRGYNTREGNLTTIHFKDNLEREIIKLIMFSDKDIANGAKLTGKNMYSIPLIEIPYFQISKCAFN